MEEPQKKKKSGIYKLISGMEIVSNPIYKGPARKDLVLDFDEHNKVITRLLTRPKGEDLSPLPEQVEDFPWVIPMGSGKQKWMDAKALKVLETFLTFAGYFITGMLLYICTTTFGHLLTSAGYAMGACVLLLAFVSGLNLTAYLSQGRRKYTYNKWALLSVAMFALGACALALPFCTQTVISRWIHVPIMVIFPLAICVFDTGVNNGILRLWGSNHGYWLHTQHFFFTLGLAMTHCVMKSGLAQQDAADAVNANAKHIPVQDLPNQEYLFVIEAPGENASLDLTAREQMDNLGKINWAHPTFGTESIFVSIPAFLVAFGFLILAFYSCMRNRVQKSGSRRSFDDAEIDEFALEDLRDSDTNLRASICIKVILGVLLLLFVTPFTWIQLNLGDFLFGYGSLIFQLPLHQATKMQLFYWASLTLGSGVGIFIPNRLKRGFLFLCAAAVTSFAVVFLYAFLTSHALASSIAASGFGFFSGSIPAATVSFVFDHFGFSGLLNVVLVGRMLGIMTGPLASHLMTSQSSLVLLSYIIPGVLMSYLIQSLLLNRIALQYGKQRKFVEAPPKSEKGQDEEGAGWLHEGGFR